jgi:hypothetical protein
MSESGEQMVGGMCRMPDLTKPLGKLCDSLVPLASSVPQGMERGRMAAHLYDRADKYRPVVGGRLADDADQLSPG